MTERMTAGTFSGQGLDDWRVLGRGAEANFHCGSYTAAGHFAAELASLCDERDHHASIDLRYPDLVHVMTTTHFRDGLTDRDTDLARAISELAAERGYESKPLDSVVVEIAIDALDIGAVRPFWQAVLDYVPEHRDGRRARHRADRSRGHRAGVLVPADGRAAAAAEPHPLDVLVPHDVAEQRIADAVGVQSCDDGQGRVTDDVEERRAAHLAGRGNGSARED